MPLIEVKLFDFRMDEDTSRKLIAGLTDALDVTRVAETVSHAWGIPEDVSVRPVPPRGPGAIGVVPASDG